MFHMSRAMYDKIEELGRLIAETEEFKAMKQAEAEGRKDPRLTECVAAYAGKQRLLEEEIGKEPKDFDRIGALTMEIDEINTEMNALPAYRTMRKAKEEYEALLGGVNDVLRSVIDPEIQCACKGNCDGCSGCGQE